MTAKPYRTGPVTLEELPRLPEPRMGLFDRLARLLRPATPEGERVEWERKHALDPENGSLLDQYSEWLNSHRDPRGELIQVIRGARNCVEGSSEAQQFSERENSLYDRYQKKWLRPILALGLKPMVMDILCAPIFMERGVFARVELDRSDILPAKAPELFAAMPALQEIHFGNNFMRPCTYDLRSIAKLPHLLQIRKMTFACGTEISATGFADLLASPYLRNLRELEVSHSRFGDAALSALAASKFITELHTLKIGSCGFGSAGLEALCNAAWIGRLRELNLFYNRVDDAGAIALARCGELHSLRSLNIACNQIGGKGIAALARSPLPDRLLAFEFKVNPSGPEGVSAVVQSPAMIKFAAGQFGGQVLGDEGAGRIVISPGIRETTDLDLSYNLLTATAVNRIADSTNLGRLERLNLQGNDAIGDDGAGTLATARNLPSLKHLDLIKTGLTDRGLASILSSPLLDQLRTLSLGANAFSAAGIDAIVQSPRLDRLEHLSLNDIPLKPGDEKRLRKKFADRVTTAADGTSMNKLAEIMNAGGE